MATVKWSAMLLALGAVVLALLWLVGKIGPATYRVISASTQVQPTVAAPPTPPPAAPLPVPTDGEVLDFLGSQLIPEWDSSLPVVTNPLAQLAQAGEPITVFPPVSYNAAKDGVRLTKIDLSLYEGSKLTARLLTPDALPIDFQCRHGNTCNFYHHPNVAPYRNLTEVDGSIQLLQTGEKRDEDITVQFKIEPPLQHSVWFKTELRTSGEANDPALAQQMGDGWIKWGSIPVTLPGKRSLQRVVVKVEIRHPDTAGMLLTENDFKTMRRLSLPALAIVGKSGQKKDHLFDTLGTVRIATDEAMLTDESYDIMIRTPTDRQLLWRIGIRCDWPPGT